MASVNSRDGGSPVHLSLSLSHKDKAVSDTSLVPRRDGRGESQFLGAHHAEQRHSVRGPRKH
eukprot:4501730-Prymnesium_polylepis.1